MWSPQGLKLFWANEERYEILQKGFEALCKKIGEPGGWFAGQIGDALDKRRLPTSFCPSARTLARFHARDERGGQPLRNAAHKGALLITCGIVWRKHFGASIASEEIKNLLDLEEHFNRDDGVDDSRTAGGRGLEEEGTPVQAALALLGMYLKQDLDDFISAGEMFFPEWSAKKPFQDIQAHFLCYRYDVKPGYVAKSFTRMHSPSADTKLCRFDNNFKDHRGRLRTASGIVVPSRQGVYLLGQVNDGEALKLIALRRRGRHQDVYEGLVLTYGSFDKILAARLVMVRTAKIQKYQDAGVGVYKASKMSEEISGFVGEIRNVVNFTLDKKILYKGREISQNAMVAKVDEVLSTEDGEPLVTFEKGERFRPADTHHYSFNSALRLPDPTDPDGEKLDD